MEHRKPAMVPRKLDAAKQKAFIEVLQQITEEIWRMTKAVMFGDAVHPTHAARPAGCWAPKDTKVVIEQTRWARAPEHSRRD